MLLEVHGMQRFTSKQWIDFFREVLPHLTTDERQLEALRSGFDRYQKILRKKYPNNKQLLFLRGFERAAQRDKMLEIVGELEQEAHIGEVLAAVKSGRLQVYDFLSPHRRTPASMVAELTGKAGPLQREWGDRALDEFVEVLGQALLVMVRTYPLFDAQMGNIMRLALNEGKFVVGPHSLTRGRDSSLATNLLARLPLFEHATVPEILDIRRELDIPLVRFRTAIMDFSETIEAAPWDEDFDSEAERIFYREVAPAVLEIEEQVHANRFLRTFATNMIEKAGLPSGGALVATVSRLADLPTLLAQLTTVSATSITNTLTVAAAAPVLGTVGKTLYQTWDSWDKENKAIAQNQLFFYYRAGQELEHRGSQ